MPLRPSILKVIAYFDLFNYPVSLEEIRFFMDREAPASALSSELDALVAEKRLFRLGTFYSLQNDPLLAERRLKGNRHADELLLIADRISRFLYQFPYVRGIGISGSLSKHFADDDSDIDYFIITSSNRLWIARTLMHLFKKWSFIRGRQHWYCMNYFLDEEALEIEEKNIFTATELITLLPACGNGGLVRFFDANNWATSFLPHYKDRTPTIPPNP
ncbi:MAG: nucleotidyltransferase domain-containing protein, partial [Bacteroidota bacterium]